MPQYVVYPDGTIGWSGPAPTALSSAARKRVHRSAAQAGPPKPCPAGCGVKVKNAKMERHLAKRCPKRPSAAPAGSGGTKPVARAAPVVEAAPHAPPPTTPIPKAQPSMAQGSTGTPKSAPSIASAATSVAKPLLKPQPMPKLQPAPKPQPAPEPRAATGRPGPKTEPPTPDPKGLVPCRECRSVVRRDRLATHLRRVHGQREQTVIRRPASAGTPAGDRAAMRRVREASASRTNPAEGRWEGGGAERRGPDGSNGTGFFAREDGRFGSYPSFDAMDDESGA